MSYRLVFHPEATVEYVAASIWYAEKLKGLDERFEKAVEHTLGVITLNPETYSTTHNTYRKAVIKEFPFVVVYKTDPELNTVFILAIYDTHRNPKGKYR